MTIITVAGVLIRLLFTALILIILCIAIIKFDDDDDLADGLKQIIAGVLILSFIVLVISGIGIIWVI